MRSTAGQGKKKRETSNEGNLLHGRSIAGAGWMARCCLKSSSNLLSCLVAGGRIELPTYGL